MLAHSHTFFSCCILALVPHAAAVRLQQAASDAKIPSPSLSSEKDLFTLASHLTSFPLSGDSSHLQRERLVSCPFSSLNLEGGSLLI